MKKGTLHAIGTGPGAPDLLTLRAVNILGKVDVILAAASPKNSYSASLEMARPYISPKARIERLDFPMSRDVNALEKAWQKAAATTLDILRLGQDAAFLTIGDPLIYSTFGYLQRTLKKMDPEVSISIAPGITSFQAAAAKAGKILCEGDESLKIVSGVRSGRELRLELEDSDATVVIMKAYRNYAAIYEALEARGRMCETIFASRVGYDDEQVRECPEADCRPPYMSLLISPVQRS